MRTLFHLKSDLLKFTGVTLENPFHIDIPEGVTAIIGPTGAGKTALADILENGRNFMTSDVSSPHGPHPVMRTIVFNDIHSLAGFKVEYYQQRYESTMNDDVPTVSDALGDKLLSPQWRDVIGQLRLNNIADKRLNFLSSGELRKMLIVNMLVDLPKILVLDNPFIGLDAPSRAVVEDMVSVIAAHGVSVLLLVSDPDDVPECVVAAVPVKDQCIGALVMRGEDEPIDSFRHKLDYLFDFSIDSDVLRSLLSKPVNIDTARCEPIVSLNDCTVAYGTKVLIENVSWEIRRGECWALMGPNGSGKSTLLSLINADNPQAYSNDVRLFGLKRGAGTSIWDIKRRIGFLSSELHLYYGGVRNTVEQVVSEGFNRALGSFDPLTESQRLKVDQWIRLFNLDVVRAQRFNTLSAGQQRLVLLLRALVRQPELLILDEPVHGLDRGLKHGVRTVVNALARCGATIIYVTHCPDELPECITLTKSLKKS